MRCKKCWLDIMDSDYQEVQTHNADGLVKIEYLCKNDMV